MKSDNNKSENNTKEQVCNKFLETWEKPIVIEMDVYAETKSGGLNPSESDAGLYS